MNINEDVAHIIKEIFEMYVLELRGKYEIATVLNHKGYLTPSQCKKQYQNINMTTVWNKQHVERILTNQVYCGDMVYGRREKENFKSKRYLRVDESDWIIVPQHHQPIITREVFEASQSRMKTMKKRVTRNPEQNIFSGLIYCGRCGSRMYKKTRKGYKNWYTCCKYDQEGSIKEDIREDWGCKPHRTKEEDLIEYMNEFLYEFLKDTYFKEKILLVFKNIGDGKEKLVNQLNQQQKKLSQLIDKASMVYDDKLENRLPLYLFEKKIGDINTKIEKCEIEISSLEKSIKETEETEETKDYFSDLINQVKNKGINNQISLLLLKKIVVFGEGEITENKKTEYDISDEEYEDILKDGGILFVQNLKYKVAFPLLFNDL